MAAYTLTTASPSWIVEPLNSVSQYAGSSEPVITNKLTTRFLMMGFEVDDVELEAFELNGLVDGVEDEATTVAAGVVPEPGSCSDKPKNDRNMLQCRAI